MAMIRTGSSERAYGDAVAKLNPNGSGYDQFGNYLSPDEVRERSGGASPANEPAPQSAPVPVAPSAPSQPPIEEPPSSGLTAISPADVTSGTGALSALTGMGSTLPQDPTQPQTQTATAALGQLRALGRRSFVPLESPLAGRSKVY